MGVVACPHCQGGVENRADLSDQVVSCPHCHRQFQMPAYQELIIPRAQAVSVPQQQPAMLVVNAGPRQRRLKPKGWAANSLAVAGVFFTCAMLFVFGTCGGLYYWMKMEVRGSVKNVGDSIVGTDAQRADARKRALSVLRRYGIKSLASNSFARRSSNSAVVSGAGLDARGATHKCSVEFDVNLFDGTERWEATSVVIDEEEMLGGSTAE